MKKVLILAVALVMSASLAFAQTGGHVGLYSDVGGTDCNKNEAFGPQYIYMVHTTAVDANTSQWMVQDNYFPAYASFRSFTAGSNLWIGSTPGNNPWEGGAVTYVGCKPLPYLVMTLTYFAGATFAPPCTATLQMVPDPVLASGQIEVVDCDETTIHYATGGLLTITGDETCPCDVATEETNWSRVKALYQ